MKHFLILFTLLMTQASWAQTPTAPASDGGLMQILPMLLLFFGIFYFIVIRPQQKEQRQHQERINSVQKGDRVVTSGGIHGTVRATKDKTLVVEIAEGVKITLNRQAISAVLENAPGKGKQTGEEEEEE